MDHGLPQQTAILPDLLRLSLETGAPAVATNDSHYLRRDDAFAHEVLLCIGMGKTLEDERRMRFYNDEFYVKEPGRDARAIPLLERGGRPELGRDRRALRRVARPRGPSPPDVRRPARPDPGGVLRGARPRRPRAAPDRGAPRGARREVPGASGIRDRRRREDGVPLLLPDRLGLHPIRPRARDLGRARARERRRLDRLLGPAHHGDRPAPLRPALREVPESRADLDARHRHRLLPGAPRRR